MLLTNMTDILAISVVGGLLSLDNVAVFQVMLSQPLIAATLIGLLLDNPQLGLITGALLQLLWTSYVPAGAVVPPDNSILACICSGTAILGLHFWSPAVAVLFSLILVVMFAPATVWADIWVRQLNNQLALSADISVLQGHLSAVTVKHLSGILIFFLKGFTLILIGTTLILLLEKGLLYLSTQISFLTSPGFVRFAGVFNSLFLTLGVGSALHLLKVPGGLSSFFLAFFICLFLVEGLKLPPEMGLVVAIGVPLLKIRRTWKGKQQ